MEFLIKFFPQITYTQYELQIIFKSAFDMHDMKKDYSEHKIFDFSHIYFLYVKYIHRKQQNEIEITQV